jgi:hypothetical protein
MIKFTYDKNWNVESKTSALVDLGDSAGIVEKILSLYDAEDCIYGLFSALARIDRRVSPFIATHNYCMRLEGISDDGIMSINASPIYHLGPEYPNEYKEKHGTELDKEAIVGLIELPTGDLTHQAHKTFSLGIDAGIVFKGSRIAHNKKLNLVLKDLGDGVFATLSCESQTTSKMFKWHQLDIQKNSATIASEATEAA